MYHIDRSSFLTFAVICFIISLSASQDDMCIKKNSCICQFKNGSIIDITSLGNKNGTPKFSLNDVNISYTYYYNPCYSFSEGSSDVCKDVAGCQVKTGTEEMYSLGDQSSAKFYMNNSQLTINYTTTQRTLNVQLVCGSPEEDSLMFKGEDAQNVYYFTLVSKCVCPDGCSTAEEDRLSTGSILVLLLFIFVLCYIFGGMLFQKIMRGATGRELFPNYEFWLDFPLLVRDGVIFSCNGCQNEVSYERI